jgi:hypothetical protein
MGSRWVQDELQFPIALNPALLYASGISGSRWSRKTPLFLNYLEYIKNKNIK